MPNPTLIFLREQIFFLEQLLEDCRRHMNSIDESDSSGHPARKKALLQGLQDRTQKLLEAFTIAANSVSFLN
jgi:hypothetical protein